MSTSIVVKSKSEIILFNSGPNKIPFVSLLLLFCRSLSVFEAKVLEYIYLLKVFPISFPPTIAQTIE